MVLWKKKSKDFVDLGERYEKQQARMEDMRQNLTESGSSEDIDLTNSPSSSSSGSSGGFLGGFFGGSGASSHTESVPISNSDVSSDERRKKLGKRILDMTNKMEDMENQIYKMQQRIEVLERKNSSGY
ncbi:hypothetical protein HOD29_06705 [archaeon]|jgi:hypothetical protein|nr:hypothetical protein [archaeon]